LVTVTDYYTSTTATSSTAGGVNGDYQDTKIKQGSGGSLITLRQVQYFLVTGST
jgi:hypothetical protein